ncbi:helix-turn-helix transcriptional regulator, partial [Mycetocola reblochoni]
RLPSQASQIRCHLNVQQSPLQAAVFARHGYRSEALALAEGMLAGIDPGASNSVDTIATALSVFFRCGTFPSEEVMSTEQLRAIACKRPLFALLLLLVLRGDDEGARVVTQVVDVAEFGQQAFRTFVFSCNSAARAADDWSLLDTQMEQRGGQEQPGSWVDGHMSQFDQLAELFECAELLVAGNLPAALKLADRSDVPEPAATLVAALTRFSTGQHQSVVPRLQSIEHAGYGARVSTIVTVFRAAALLRDGKIEQARGALEGLAHARSSHLVFALSLLAEDDLAGLLQVYDETRFSEAAVTARVVGAAGIGRRLATRSYVESLTKREQQVLELLQLGYTDRQIADACFVSLNTTKSQLQSLRKKLRVSGRQNILARARELHLLQNLG